MTPVCKNTIIGNYWKVQFYAVGGDNQDAEEEKWFALCA